MSSTPARIPAGVKRAIGVALSLHLVVAVVHSVPHFGVPIVQSNLLTAIIATAVYVLPVVGFAFVWRGRARTGIGVFTVGMAFSFAIGVVLHFLVPNPDHVSSVSAEPWHLPFLVTSIGIALTDAAGTAAGIWSWRALDAPSRELRQSGRIAGVPDAGFRPLTRLIYWGSRRWYGEVPEPLAVTAHHGSILWGSSTFETALDRADRVDDHLKDLANVTVATMVGCRFCIDISSFLADEHGITETQLRNLQNFEESDAFTDLERLVLRYAVAMTETPTTVPDELYEELEAAFDEAELVELTASIAYENYRARFNHAFGIDAQGFSEGEYCLMPEAPPTERQASRGSIERD